MKTIAILTLFCAAALLFGCKPAQPSNDVRNGTGPQGANLTFSMKKTILGTHGANLTVHSEVLVSPDARHLAVVLAKGGKAYMSLDGNQLAEHITDRADWAFSPDSRHLAYADHAGEESIVTVDGQEIHVKGIVDEVFFSPDSKRVGYLVKNWEDHISRIMEEMPKEPLQKWLVIDGVETAKYNDIAAPTFSADSQHIAFVVGDGRGVGDYVVVDGIAGKKYGRIRSGYGLQIGPDGKTVAFIAETTEHDEHLVVGDKEYPEFNRLPIWSPDGKRAAYMGIVGGDKTTIFIGSDPGKIDKGENFEYRRTTEVVFSPDSQHYAFVAYDDKSKKWTLVIDGKENAAFEGIAAFAPVFSPDSKRTAFALVETYEKQAVVLDGIKGKTYGGVDASPYSGYYLPPVFSPDSKHLVYSATGKGKFVVFDGIEIPIGRELEGKIANQFILSKFVFDSPTHFHAIGFADSAAPGLDPFNILLYDVDIKGE